MQATPCPIAGATRLLTLLTASVLLVQCAMPPQQTWRYIQTNGLLSYLGTSQQSPPLRIGSANSQRYVQRASPAPHGFPQASSRLPNSYFVTPATASRSSRHVPRTRVRSQSYDRTPDVKMPVEEPAAEPQFSDNTPPVSSTPKDPATNTSAADLPYGSAIPGRMNMVNSPYAGKTQLVDVSGMSAGQTVKCPYTGKLFKVPPTQQAANHAESRLEAKVEAPELRTEPKSEEKKP